MVVADDLTGANATGVLLVQHGWRALSLLGADGPALAAARRWLDAPEGRPGARAASALVFNTESRALPPEQAAERVRRVLLLASEHLQAAPIVAKRIDSTARGNLGSEVAAALDVLGPQSFAVVTPAYPASGRTVVGGYLLVNGVPVTRTPAARDPLTPVRHAHVPALLEAQQPFPVGHVGLASVLAGAASVRQALLEAVEAGRRIIVVDAVSDEDVQSVADALVDVAASLGVPAVCADPGPLTAATFARLIPPTENESGIGSGPEARQAAPGPVLVVAGSATDLTARQLAALERQMGVALEVADVAALVGRDAGPGSTRRAPEGSPVRDSKRCHELERLASSILSRWATPCAGLRSLRGPEDLLAGLTPSEQQALLQGLGQAVRMALDRARQLFGARPAGLYLTGGDVTAAVVRALDAVAIELVDQVLPLAAFGRLVGGPYEGLAVVSKGGLVGGEDAAIQCVRRLLACREKASASRVGRG